MPPKHECRWRSAADKLTRELEAERSARQEAEAKLASALVQNAEYEKRLFGRTTERVAPVDRELRAADKASEATGEPTSPSRKSSKKKPRPEQAPGVRHEVREWPVSDRVRKCPYCGEMAQPIGTGKFTTEWDYVPGYFVRRRHIQETVACSCGKHIARAEAPLRVFDRTQYGPGLIAYLIVSKCGDSMPTYRAEKHFARLGVPIARSTLGDLIHRAAEILTPLYDRLLARIVADAHCQADETSFRLLNRPEKRGFVWTFLAGRLIAYVFSGDRSGQTPARVLGGTTGSLVVDAYTGYNDVTDVDGRTRAGCWSHARRYLFRALGPAPEAREALDMILELFRVERDAVERGTFGTNEHARMRRDRSEPVVAQIQTWVAEQRPKHLPAGPMGAALRYITNQWKPLTVFLSDPKIPIHNNASESALRIVALARKNSLFFGNEQAARHFSVLYSLVQTAEHHGVNALAYLEDVLMRVQTHPAARIDELLPDLWKPG
ncbi:MAG TPA: IS66 family transposase [Solirubrobacteraceae bacterium]|nr:IS66 family transposase [Solirubrobacteraceae bacterium]